MIIAIDFDDTIHNTKNRKQGFKMGQPMPGAIQALKELSIDNKIIIHTIWGGNPEMKRAISGWLDYFDIPYDQITNVKPKADVYIDDKAIHFTNWKETLDKLNDLA